MASGGSNKLKIIEHRLTRTKRRHSGYFDPHVLYPDGLADFDFNRDVLPVSHCPQIFPFMQSVECATPNVRGRLDIPRKVLQDAVSTLEHLVLQHVIDFIEWDLVLNDLGVQQSEDGLLVLYRGIIRHISAYLCSLYHVLDL